MKSYGRTGTAGSQSPQFIEGREPSDIPQPLQEGQDLQRHLPDNWVLGIYGIPQTQSALRRELCWILKSHGLQSIDIGGSVYLGPKSDGMDEEVRDLVEKLRQRTGFTGWVKLFVGDYDQLTASMFLNSVISTTFEELKSEEAKMDELEKAITPGSGVVIKNRDGEAVNLVTTGYGRIDSMKKAIDAADSMVARFQGSQELESEGARLRTRINQLSAWARQIEAAFKRFAEVERARQKKEAA